MSSSLASVSHEGLSMSTSQNKSSQVLRASSERHLSDAVYRHLPQFNSLDKSHTMASDEGTPLLIKSIGNRLEYELTAFDNNFDESCAESTATLDASKKKDTSRKERKYVRSTSVSLPIAHPVLKLPKAVTSLMTSGGIDNKSCRTNDATPSKEFVRISGDYIQLVEFGQLDDYIMPDSGQLSESEIIVDAIPQPKVTPLLCTDVNQTFIRRSSSATSPNMKLPSDSAFWSNFDLTEAGDFDTGRIRRGEHVLPTSRTGTSLVSSAKSTSVRGRILRRVNDRKFPSLVKPTINPNEYSAAEHSPNANKEVICTPLSRRRLPRSLTLMSKLWPTSCSTAQVKMTKSSSELKQLKFTSKQQTNRSRIEAPNSQRNKFVSLGNVVQQALIRKQRTTVPPTSLQLLPMSSLSFTNDSEVSEGDEEESALIKCRVDPALSYKGRTTSNTAVYGGDNSQASSEVTSLTDSRSITVESPIKHRGSSTLVMRDGACDKGYRPVMNPVRSGRRGTRVRINVSGQCFETRLFMLDRHPTTLLGNNIRRLPFYDIGRRELFFDRHRPSFEAIFIYLQTGGRLRRPYHVPNDVFLAEVEFFELEADVVDEYKRSEGYTFEDSPMPSNPVMRCIWELFEYPETSRPAFVIALFSVVMTLLSIILFCIETLPVFSTSHCVADEAPNFGDPFFVMETLCTSWFTIEAIVRFIACPSKIDFWKDFKNVVDVMAVIPYYVTLFNVLSTMSCSSAKSSASLSFLRVIRLIRVFKLTKHSVGLQVLMLTFKASLEGLGLFLVALVVSLLVFSSAIYYAELGHPSTKMRSIPDACWWAIITMTTVGYGDMVPVGIIGRLIGAACAITGVLTLAIPVPIITGHFNRFYAYKTGRGRHV